jgi:hypothetical protein
MRLVTLVRDVTIAFLPLCPISVGHGQSPAEFYKGKNVNSTSSPSAIDDQILSCKPCRLLATKQTASIHRRTIGHLASVGFIQMLRVDTGMRR